MYDQDAKVRSRIARGMVFLSFTYIPKDEKLVTLPLWALKKFPDGTPSEEDSWRRYFVLPPAETHRIVVTRKANGSAGHFTVIEVDEDDYVYIGGSKNVHCAVRKREDLYMYMQEVRYNYAVMVMQACFTLLERIDRTTLCKELVERDWTLCMELIDPSDQHVEKSKADQPSVVVYAATSYCNAVSLGMHYWCESPVQDTLTTVAGWGIPTVDYETSEYDLSAIMQRKKRELDHEGYVLYFQDWRFNVIGVMKVKTFWYAYLRTMRECARRYYTHPEKTIEGAMRSRIESAMNRDSLAYSGRPRQAWLDLATGFETYTRTCTRAELADVVSKFPEFWTTFLTETSSSDDVQEPDL